LRRKYSKETARVMRSIHRKLKYIEQIDIPEKNCEIIFMRTRAVGSNKLKLNKKICSGQDQRIF